MLSAWLKSFDWHLFCMFLRFWHLFVVVFGQCCILSRLSGEVRLKHAHLFISWSPFIKPARSQALSAAAHLHWWTWIVTRQTSVWKMHQFYGFDLGRAGKAITIDAPRKRALTHFLQILGVEGAPKDAPLYFMNGPWRTAMTSKRTSFSHGHLLVDLLLITELPEGIIAEAIRNRMPVYTLAALARLRVFAAESNSGSLSCWKSSSFLPLNIFNLGEFGSCIHLLL